MTTIENIEEFLNLEIGERRLRCCRKNPEKNQYYYFENQYYIVQLTKGVWMIAETVGRRENCCGNIAGMLILVMQELMLVGKRDTSISYS